MKIKLMPFRFAPFLFCFVLFFLSSPVLKYSQTSALSSGSREQKAAGQRLDVQEKEVLKWPDKKTKKTRVGWGGWHGNNRVREETVKPLGRRPVRLSQATQARPIRSGRVAVAREKLTRHQIQVLQPAVVHLRPPRQSRLRLTDADRLFVGGTGWRGRGEGVRGGQLGDEDM